MQQHDNSASAVIWDMGGVLYRFFTEIMVEKGAEWGWPVDKLPLGPTGSAPDPHYLALDQGEIKEPEYIRRITEELSQHGIDFLPYKVIPPLRTETLSLLGKVKAAGLKQILLTNDATNWLGERWWETWPQMHFFDDVVDVKTIGYPKPHPEAYLACLNKLDVPARECLFVDDMHVNCSGAQAVGMQSYWFDISAPKTAVAELRSQLRV